MKFYRVILLAILILAISNYPVTSKQGVNYIVKTIKMPLYIKTIEFFDRDYHHKELVKRIIKGCDKEEDRVLTLLEWTYTNIRRAPKDFPVIDDHVWHIIIRGYGNKDQFSDVFATLCNYVKMQAFFTWVSKKGYNSEITFSAVKINKRWCLFDPYNGVYFKNKNNEFASIEDIKNGDWLVYTISETKNIPFDYQAYFKDFSLDIKEGLLSRANIQSPLRRFIFELRKWVKVGG